MKWRAYKVEHKRYDVVYPGPERSDRRYICFWCRVCLGPRLDPAPSGKGADFVFFWECCSRASQGRGRDKVHARQPFPTQLQPNMASASSNDHQISGIGKTAFNTANRGNTLLLHLQEYSLVGICASMRRPRFAS